MKISINQQKMSFMVRVSKKYIVFCLVVLVVIFSNSLHARDDEDCRKASVTANKKTTTVNHVQKKPKKVELKNKKNNSSYFGLFKFLIPDTLR